MACVEEVCPETAFPACPGFLVACVEEVRKGSEEEVMVGITSVYTVLAVIPALGVCIPWAELEGPINSASDTVSVPTDVGGVAEMENIGREMPAASSVWRVWGSSTSPEEADTHCRAFEVVTASRGGGAVSDIDELGVGVTGLKRAVLVTTGRGVAVKGVPVTVGAVSMGMGVVSVGMGVVSIAVVDTEVDVAVFEDVVEMEEGIAAVVMMAAVCGDLVMVTVFEDVVT